MLSQGKRQKASVLLPEAQIQQPPKQGNWAPVTKHYPTQVPDLPKLDKTEFSTKKF